MLMASYGQSKINRNSSNQTIPTNEQQSINQNVQLQQILLLSRQQQLAFEEQAKQKVLLDKQKLALAEQEKQLLELRFQKKQGELIQEKNLAEQNFQKNKMQAQMDAIVKDRQINAQQTIISSNKKWNLFLSIFFAIVIIFAAITFYNERKTKKLNAIISKQHAELEEVGMVKDTLLSVVSHDMRAPVNSLIAFTDLLNDGEISSEKLGMYLNQISSTLNHTSFMMNNMLNWAASQMHGFKTEMNAIDLGLISAEIVASFMERAKTKGIQISINIKPGILVSADKNMLDLIIRNLLSNALKYTSKGGTIQLMGIEKYLDVIFTMNDNGVGMQSIKMTQFNAPATSQVESTQGTEKEKGTGLGLLLCKTFAALMNGKMKVYQNPEGQGTCFELILKKGKRFI
jgi:signal transduction histidine kinase